MKCCGNCHKNLSTKLFNWKDKKRGKLQSYCRACQKVVKDKHYRNNKQDYIDKARRNNKKVQRKIQDIKSNTPCKDCKHKFHFSAMEFDHKRNKKFEISRGWQYGWSKVLKEMKKCDIVCSNCHRVRTFKRNGGVC